MADIKELDKSVRVSWGLVAYMIVGLVAATYALTTIYNKFLMMDEKIHDLELKIEYIDGRHDRKEGRQQETIEELDARVTDLERPNSDK